MAESFDIVIGGGAVMGSSIAYHLAAHPGFAGRILVIDRDMTYRQAASSLSLSSIRQQFSSPINIRIGQTRRQEGRLPLAGGLTDATFAA